MLLLSRLQPLSPPLLSLLSLLLSLLPLLLAAGSARAVAAELRPGPEVEAATRAFQNKGPSAESDSDEGYEEVMFQIDTEIEASTGVFVRVICALKRSISCDSQTPSITLT